MDFFQIWYTNKAHSGLFSPENLEIFKLTLRELRMNDFIAKNGSKTSVVPTA